MMDKIIKPRYNPENPHLRNFFKLAYIFGLELNRTIFGKKFAAEFDVTYRCNLRCDHCYNPQLSDDKSKEIPIEVWKKRFKKMYDSGIRLVQLMGGEPTLRMDVIEQAVKTFPFVYVSTNGLIKIPNDWDLKIILSIDGMRERNDEIRGEGVFDKAMDNYSGDGRVLINMVLTMENYKELEDVVQLAKRSNFSGVVCNIYSTTTYNDDDKITGENRQLIIDELRRVRALYPDTLLMNEIMIKWFEDADHEDYCHWRENVHHYNVDWSPRVCYLDEPDCRNCGCMAGAMQPPLKLIRYPLDMIKIVAFRKTLRS